MGAEKGPFDWNSWLWWIALTALSTITAMFMIFFVVFNLSTRVVGTFSEDQTASLLLQLATAPLFALAGAIAGGGQWLVLRGLFNRSGWWILATAGGWMAGYLWSFLLLPASSGTLTFGAAILPWAINGFATGLCQWLVLRHHYDRSGLWIPTATLAMAIGTTGWLIGGTFGGAILWLVAGALSGWILLRTMPPKTGS